MSIVRIDTDKDYAPVKLFLTPPFHITAFVSVDPFYQTHFASDPQAARGDRGRTL